MVVNVKCEMAGGRMGFGANSLLMFGATTAVNGAVATLVVVVPLSVVTRKPLTLVCGPAGVAVTLTLTVHDPLAGMVGPGGEPNVSEGAAAMGAQGGEPPQAVRAAGGAACCTPAAAASGKW